MNGLIKPSERQEVAEAVKQQCGLAFFAWTELEKQLSGVGTPPGAKELQALVSTVLIEVNRKR